MDSENPQPGPTPAAPILNIDLLEPSDDEDEPPTPTLAFLTKATSASFFQKPPRAETVVPTSSLSSLAPAPDPPTTSTGRKRSRKKSSKPNTAASGKRSSRLPKSFDCFVDEDEGDEAEAQAAAPPRKRRRKKKRTNPPTFVPVPGIDVPPAPAAKTKPNAGQPGKKRAAPRAKKPPFTNLVICVSCIPNPARSTIRSHCLDLGGTYVQPLTPEVTHLIVPESLEAITPKVRSAATARPPVIIVSSDWIDACVEKKRKVTERPYLMFGSLVNGRGRTGKKGARAGLDVGGDQADGFVLGLMDDLDGKGYDEGDGFVVGGADGDGAFVLRRDEDDDDEVDDMLFVGNVVDEPEEILEETKKGASTLPPPPPSALSKPSSVPETSAPIPKKSAPAPVPTTSAPLTRIHVPVQKSPGLAMSSAQSSLPASVSPPLKKKKPKAPLPTSSSIGSLEVPSGPGVVLSQVREDEIHKSLVGILQAAPQLKENVVALKKHVDSVFDRTVELLRTTGDGYRIFDASECVNFPPRAIPRDVKLCIRTSSDVDAQVQRLQQCKEEYDAVLDLRLRCERGSFEIDLPSILVGSAFFIDPVTLANPDSRRHLKMLIYRCGGVVVSDPLLAPPEGRSLIVLVREGIEELEDARRAALGPKGVVVESSFVTECWNKKRMLPLAAFEVV